MSTKRVGAGLIGMAPIGLIVAACGGSPSASGNGAPATAPTGWSEVSWTDPGLAVALPASWSAGDPTVTGDPSMVATLSGDQLKAQQWYDQMVGAGTVRFLANGPMPTSQGTIAGGSIDVTVEIGNASLSAFADREAGVDANIGAQQIWTRLVSERQINILEYDQGSAAEYWTKDGGVGEAPIAWVRSGDGVIRFNLAKFMHPAPPKGPR